MPRNAGSSTPYILGFLVLALAALGANWRLDIARRDGRQLASSINNELRLAEQGVLELRGAQAAYLAEGLKSDEWMNRATTAVVQLESAIGALGGQTKNAPEARPHYADAAVLIADVTVSDKKAKSFVIGGQPLVAADVLFREGAESVTRLTTALAAARDSEMAAFEKSAVTLGYIGLGINGGALALGLILLMVAARARANAPADAAVEGFNLHTTDTAPVQAPAPTPEAAADPFLAPSVDLSSAAELCVDLGRVLDGRDLPALMGRAADVLEAKGLVLWVSESNGAVLRPSVAHGYSDRVLQRMGTLPADGDNVTSLAFRSMQPQVLRSPVEGHGAIAVPLLTAGGCVGVLAAEVQGAKPGDTRFAIARMIAAQLATLVGPGSAAPAKSSGASS